MYATYCSLIEENLHFTHLCTTVIEVIPWLEIGRVFNVGRVIQFTLDRGFTCFFNIYCSWHICVPWSKAPHRSLAGRWRPFVSRDLSVACRQKRQPVQIPINDISLREIEKQGTFTIGIQFSQDGSPRTLPPPSAGRYYKQRLRRVKLWL